MFRKKWIAGGVCFLMLLGLWMFRMPIFTRLCPGAVLSIQTRKTLTVLKNRFSDEPFRWLEEALPDSGNQRIRAQLLYSEPGQEDVPWKMDLQLQSRPAAMAGEGHFTSSGRRTELAFYLDEESAALRLPETEKSGWYGIRFDSFLRSLEENDLLEILLGDSSKLMQGIKSEDKVPVLPDLSVPAIPWDVLRDASAGLALLPYKVSRTDEGYWLHTSLDAQALEAMARKTDFLSGVISEQWTEALKNSEITEISGNFLLGDWNISFFSITVMLKEQSVQLMGNFEEDLSLDGFSLQIRLRDSTAENKMALEIHPRSEEGERGTAVFSGGERLEVCWSGGIPFLHLRWTGKSQADTVEVQLSRIPEGLRIWTPKAGPLVAELTGWEFPYMDRWGEGQFVLEEGEEIAPPEYMDFSCWSLEELFSIMDVLDRLPGKILG